MSPKRLSFDQLHWCFVIPKESTQNLPLLISAHWGPSNLMNQTQGSVVGKVWPWHLTGSLLLWRGIDCREGFDCSFWCAPRSRVPSQLPVWAVPGIVRTDVPTKRPERRMKGIKFVALEPDIPPDKHTHLHPHPHTTCLIPLWKEEGKIDNVVSCLDFSSIDSKGWGKPGRE